MVYLDISSKCPSALLIFCPLNQLGEALAFCQCFVSVNWQPDAAINCQFVTGYSLLCHVCTWYRMSVPSNDRLWFEILTHLHSCSAWCEHNTIWAWLTLMSGSVSKTLTLQPISECLELPLSCNGIVWLLGKNHHVGEANCPLPPPHHHPLLQLALILMRWWWRPSQGVEHIFLNYIIQLLWLVNGK